MDQFGREKRRDERVFTALPVDLGNASGLTRDVSASGVFFEIDASYRLGSTIEFAVELETPGGKMLLKCEGEIVRIEPRGARVGVAVKIVESSLEPLRE
ncbi:MAG: PilZ domain-containing protein [Betaproteobacteria bacterium]